MITLDSTDKEIRSELYGNQPFLKLVSAPFEVGKEVIVVYRDGYAGVQIAMFHQLHHQFKTYLMPLQFGASPSDMEKLSFICSVIEEVGQELLNKNLKAAGEL